jgi:hypothetical protein
MRPATSFIGCRKKSSKPKRPSKSTADAASSQIVAAKPSYREEALAPTPARNASDAETQPARDGGTGLSEYPIWCRPQRLKVVLEPPKQGEFMTEQDAIKAGCKAAKKREVILAHSGLA